MAKKVAARTLDFSNVKESSGINPKHVEDGDYLAKVIEVRDDPAKDGEAMWLFIFKLADNTTATYPYYCKLVDNQLWKLRNLFIAAGVDLPKRAVKIDPNKVVGKEVGLVLEGEEYEGKMKSVISAIIPKSDLAEYAAGADEDDDDEDDDEEEEVVPVKRGRGRPKKVVEEEDDEDEDDEEEEAPAPKKRGRPRKVVEPEEDDDDEEDEEPAPKKRGRGRPRKVVEPEEDEDDEDDEEPAPVKRGRGRPRKAAAAPVRKKRRAADDDDDDLELDL
jgi:hypothetical protein